MSTGDKKRIIGRVLAAEWLSRYIAYPIWDIKDKSQRLRQYRQLKEDQWRNQQQIRRIQLARLQEVMEHAYTTTRYYSGRWDRDPVRFPLKTMDELDDFPVLTKDDVREYQCDLLSSKFSARDLCRAKTGGSTGVALELFFDTRCQEYRNAAALMSDEWAGWKIGMRRGALWGSPPVPSDIKSQLRNMLHDRVFYLDTMGLNDKTMLRFYAEINRSGRCALFGHAHSLYELARFFEFNNYRANNVEAIIATSMMLLPMHRQFIETVFGMKVTDRYGCEEVGLIASECGEHNGLHINDMHVVVEGLGPDLSHVGKGKQAELVVTDLNNYGMPMIRYVVGDEATMLDEPCRCGRGLSMLSKISGRTADYLVKADGSRVSGISMVEQTLTSIPGIRELQIVQNSFVDFELYMVRSKDFSPETISMLKQALRDVFGEKIVVNVNSVNSLPKTNQGKSRFSICKI